MVGSAPSSTTRQPPACGARWTCRSARATQPGSGSGNRSPTPPAGARSIASAASTPPSWRRARAGRLAGSAAAMSARAWTTRGSLASTRPISWWTRGYGRSGSPGSGRGCNTGRPCSTAREYAVSDVAPSQPSEMAGTGRSRHWRLHSTSSRSKATPPSPSSVTTSDSGRFAANHRPRSTQSGSVTLSSRPRRSTARPGPTASSLLAGPQLHPQPPHGAVPVQPGGVQPGLAPVVALVGVEIGDPEEHPEVVPVGDERIDRQRHTVAARGGQDEIGTGHGGLLGGFAGDQSWSAVRPAGPSPRVYWPARSADSSAAARARAPRTAASSRATWSRRSCTSASSRASA